MGDNEQTPALPEMWFGMRDGLWSIALADQFGWVEAGTGEPLSDPESMGWTRLEPLTAGRTVLEPSTEEQWCHFYGGPDPDNAAGNRICDDEVDAREASEWVVTLGGKGIARRMVRYGPWEVVDFTPDCLAEIKDGSDA